MAVKVWTGGAAGIAQRDSITIGGTWATDETLRVSIGGSNLDLTVGAASTTSGVAEALAAAINATGRTSSLVGSESRNVGGQQIAEFTELTAASSGSVVTLEANTLGIPFTLTASATSSTGTAVATTTVSATGANFFDNTQNWADGSIPVSGDKLVFQHNAVDCLYGLDQTALTNMTLQVDASYIGRIGLPPYNERGYDEYRSRHLALKFSLQERAIVIGEGPGAGSGRVNLDLSTSSPKIVVLNTGAAEARAKAAVDFKGGSSTCDISIRRGSISIAADSAQSATVRKMEISYETQPASDARVYAGDQSSIAEIMQSGGQIYMINTGSGSSISTVTQLAGYAEYNGFVAATLVTLQGGECRWHSIGALQTLKLAGAAVFDVSRDMRVKTIANPVDRYSPGSRLIDPYQVIAGLIVDNNQISDLSGLVLGTDFRITRAATA